MDITQLPFRLRTERQRKRSRKSDFDKQLLALRRLEDILWNARKALPMVPLEEPYQKGWKRSFVLREDVKRSGHAAFYEELLAKINTVEYSADKLFKVKKRRKARNIYVARQQHLRAFTWQEWIDPKLKITDKEKPHFHWQQIWNPFQKNWHERLVFNEPWRYVLKVKPHMITHAKMLDNVLEQQIAQLGNYIDRNHLRARISKITGGDFNYGVLTYAQKEKHRNEFKNKPLHVILDAYMDEQTTT